MMPEDGDVHTVLGLLYNLSRDYGKAITSFETALKLKPRDYSLWNKLGATQANSARSADAIYAYQEALDLKPNYVRAWSNMGIGYANQGQYKESIRYYIRALAMNPKADNAWQYLRISLRYMCFTLQLVEKFAVHQNSFHLYVLISQFGTLCIACLPCSFDQILCLRLSVNFFAVVHHDLI
jgi:tetratricopeptide (TPR) repeat protein